MKSSLQNTEALLPERLTRQGAGLTASEQALALALGRDYPHALLESATALATRTGTSPSTVVRLFAKLGVQNQAHAVSIAMRAGLIDLRGQRLLADA